jgi:hypothetical protein
MADITDANVHLMVQDADERLASLMAAIDSAGSYDAKRELWLGAIDDSQFEQDMRTLFGTLPEPPEDNSNHE